MTPPTDVVLYIGDGISTLPPSVERALRAAGLDLHGASQGDGIATVQEWVANDAPPPAVVLTEDIDNPLAVARQVRHAAPLVQIVFLAGPGRSALLRKEMMLAPLIGPHWTIVDPEDASMPRVLVAAVRATRQRSNLRTTLDRMNLKLQEQQPATDSATYRALVISDRYLASVLEHAGDAIIVVDRLDRIVTWNRGASRLFGHEESDVLDQPVDVLAGRGAASELRTLLLGARAGRVVARHELVCARADGTPVDVEATVAPVRDEAGRIVSVSLIARDVTARKRAELELKLANAAQQEALDLLAAKQQELLEVNAKLELQATTDALTGLKNRVVFHNSLMEMMAVAGRQGTELSLLLIDVDHFKRVNDTRGHLEGDRALRAIAKCLEGRTRRQDIVARYGGEEFAVLLPNTAMGAAAAVAESLRVACRNVVEIEPELTISVGVASFGQGDTDVTLIGRADEALYASKLAGRDRVTQADALS